MRKGFVLTELIIIIIIIGILAALLLPALKSVSDKAKQAKCKANLSQIGKALFMYKADFGRYRRYPDANGGSFLARMYSTKILLEKKVFICPATGDYTNDQRLQELGSKHGENSGDGYKNAISYAGRKNAIQRRYPGLFRMHRDTAITSIGSDDFHQPAGTSYNHSRVNIFLFQDGHTESRRIQGYQFKELCDPLTN